MSEEHCRIERTAHHTQDGSSHQPQQQQQQQQPSSPPQVNSGVAMAMEVLAKAEERLKELHIQEERLKVRYTHVWLLLLLLMPAHCWPACLCMYGTHPVCCTQITAEH
jgi:hypothetical protein